MRCESCGAAVYRETICPICGADINKTKDIIAMSARLYNSGLKKAGIRDLCGAADDLALSIFCDKMNIRARNLLGLVYYETGKTGDALSEWVISQNLQPEENPASAYLSEVQKKPAKLADLNYSIQKYNQCLRWIREGNEDLAIVQLKKIRSLHPRMVRAGQLLTCLYMQRGRYDLASRVLKEIRKIDPYNTDTLLYAKECRESLRRRKKTAPAVSADPENVDKHVIENRADDIPIRMSWIDRQRVMPLVANLLIGAAVGVAVVSFLVIPEIKQNANSAAARQIVENDQVIAEKEATIRNLKEQAESVQDEIDAAEESTRAANEQKAAYEELLGAYAVYAEGDYISAGESMQKIDTALLSDEALAVYQSMEEKVQAAELETLWAEGKSAYENKRYEEAITTLTQVVAIDSGYEGGNAAYFLAFAYYYSDEKENALTWFQTAADAGAQSSIGSISRSMASNIEEEIAMEGGQ